MKHIQWRRLLPRDTDAVYALEVQCFTQPWARESFLDEFSHPERAVYFGAFSEEENLRLLAYGGYWVICDEAHITNIAVREDCRRQGLGRAMMRRLINDAGIRGLNSMTLEVRRGNKAAQALYEALGFEAAGTRPGYYADTREDALIYWLRLKD